MVQGHQPVYQSGGIKVDLTRRELLSDGIALPIGSRAFEIVEALVQSAGELVSKDDLIDRVWRGAIVGDNTLQVHVSAIRKALGSHRGMLKTDSGRGYRLLGDWVMRQDDIPTALPAADASLAPVQSISPITNLPAIVGGLIGRSAARQQLHDVLSAYRIVTLTGPGGIGKTALALEVSRNMLADFDGGGWLVELASLSDPGLVPSAVARVLGLRLAGEAVSAEVTARGIGTRNVLLVLDNCEHLIDAVAVLVETIVRLCPRTTVLTTSREVLRIDGEYVYRVPPLDVPAPGLEEPDHVLNHSAVAFFVAKMQAYDSAFSPNGENLSVIAAICQHLDGIPLAIEFAAARAATLGVQQVALGLEDRFSLLTSSRRTALPRHQTLRAAFDWSYGLLPEEERVMLRRLAIFAGSFTLEGASAVVGERGIAPSVVDGIANLVSKSLTMLVRSETGSWWRLGETIRAYGAEKLAESGELNAISRRHAEYYRDLFEHAEVEIETHSEADWLATHAEHLDNVRAAIDWAFSPAGDAAIGVALTVAVVPLWHELSLMDECGERVERAMRAQAEGVGATPRSEMKLSAALGAALYYTKGAVPEIDGAWSKALEIAERLDECDYQVRALWGLWSYRISAGDYPTANTLAQRFRDIAAQRPDHGDRLIAERMLGGTLHFLGHQIEARNHIELMLAEYDSAIYRPHIARFHYDQQLAARVTLARILWLQGFTEQAMDTAAAAVAEARATEQPISVCFALAEAACPIASFVGDFAAADRYVAMLLDHSARHGLAVFHTRGLGASGVLTAKRENPATGIQLIRSALLELSKIGYHAYPMLLGTLAEALGEVGQADEGLAAIEEALSRCERNGERWYIADLLRVRGGLRLRQVARDFDPAAEDEFGKAIDVAREQGALFWEMRATLSLARLRLASGRRAEAKDILVPVHGRFTEGFSTADLLAAKALLAELG
jgi:predicted ATPase/DNA-binding winged helix-turn-helix (wHTH) protein